MRLGLPHADGGGQTRSLHDSDVHEVATGHLRSQPAALVQHPHARAGQREQVSAARNVLRVLVLLDGARSLLLRTSGVVVGVMVVADVAHVHGGGGVHARIETIVVATSSRHRHSHRPRGGRAKR